MTKIALALGEECLLASVAPLIDAVGVLRSYAASVERTTGERWRPLPELSTLNSSGRDAVLFGGIVLPVHGSFNRDVRFDAIYIPSSARMHVPKLRLNARKNRRLIEWIAQQHSKGAIVAAAGDGIFPVADAGLLTNGYVTTSKVLAPTFEKRHPSVELDMDVVIAEHDRVLTGGPLGCELQLVIRLLQHAISPTVAEFMGEITELDRARRTMLFPSTPNALDDPVVARARRWLRENSLKRVTAVELAAALELHPRTLARRFQRSLGMSPHDFIQVLRIEGSKRLLMRTDLPVEQIAARMGYSNTNHFRSIFRKLVGVLPSKYRESRRG